MIYFWCFLGGFFAGAISLLVLCTVFAKPIVELSQAPLQAVPKVLGNSRPDNARARQYMTPGYIKQHEADITKRTVG